MSMERLRVRTRSTGAAGNGKVDSNIDKYDNQISKS